MSGESRRIVVDFARNDGPTVAAIASISFCESSASLTIDKITVHLPWTELAKWQAWLAAKVEEGSE